MLVANSHREFAGGTLRSTIFLERRFRAHLVNRDRLVYDSGYAPPAKQASPFVHLYATLSGSFAPVGGTRVDGRQAWVLAESEFDRVLPSARKFRSFGEPAVIVELRIPASDLHRPAGMDHGQIELPDAVWEAYDELARDRNEAALQCVIAALNEAKIVSQALTASVVATEPERFMRLWTVLKPLYEDLATSASLKQIATIAGLSLRQLGRDLGDLTRTFGLFGAGFRDAMRVLRLRAACLWLSAPGATPSEVAKTVGYGSLDAMGRAFRDANLPAPSVVQEAVRYRS
ncbi:MAG: AraC family transcriptional regulator [Kofleriaceae bacterium]